MEILRTPDRYFEGLAGFDFEPHYAEIPDQDGGTLRVHYLDEGPPRVRSCSCSMESRPGVICTVT